METQLRKADGALQLPRWELHRSHLSRQKTQEVSRPELSMGRVKRLRQLSSALSRPPPGSGTGSRKLEETLKVSSS